MKIISVFAAVLVVLSICLLGCKSKDEGHIITNPPGVWVTVTMDRDTLRFLPNDVVTALGVAEVTNTSGIVPGMKVSLSLQGTTIGQIEYVNTVLRDTTDENGQVHFRFVWYGINESLAFNTVRALAGSATGERRIYLQPIGSGFVAVTATPDTLHLGDVEDARTDSSLVMITLTDITHRPISNVTVHPIVSGGTLRAFPPTDVDGRAVSRFLPGGAGRFSITVNAASLTCDTAWVVADTLTVTDVGSVRMTLASDTLHFAWGDSASVLGTVLVRGESGVSLAGKRVLFSLSEQVGSIQFENAALRDTTDITGIVHFRFTTHSDAGPGYNVIRAECGGHTDSATVHLIMQGAEPGSLTLSLNPDTLHTRGAVADSFLVSVTLRDNHSLGIPGRLIPFTASSGILRAMPPTDSAGHTSGYWHLSNYGEHYVAAHVGSLTDTAWAVVDSFPYDQVASVQIVMRTDSDTLRFFPGDSAWAEGFVQVRDLQGRAVPNAQVDVSEAESFIGFLTFPDSSRDTTNALGRVNFTFQSNQQTAGYTVLHAACGGHEDNQPLWVRPSPYVPGSLMVQVSPDTLHAHGTVRDSVMVAATVVDTSNIGIPGATVHFWASAGHLSSFAPTNASGRTLGYWHPGGYGTFFVAGSFASLLSVDTLVVDSLLRGR
ncbi:MAG TPA: hypothetical protein VGL38_05045 [bacterium]|jgi:hypothetical protein